MTTTEDGYALLLPGDEASQRFGFTKDKFGGWLTVVDDAIYVSFIISKEEGKGNFRALVQSIIDAGLSVKVPTPFDRMENIIERLGFIHTIESHPVMGDVDVWVLKP